MSLHKPTLIKTLRAMKSLGFGEESVDQTLECVVMWAASVDPAIDPEKLRRGVGLRVVNPAQAS